MLWIHFTLSCFTIFYYFRFCIKKKLYLLFYLNVVDQIIGVDQFNEIHVHELKSEKKNFEIQNFNLKKVLFYYLFILFL